MTPCQHVLKRTAFHSLSRSTACKQAQGSQPLTHDPPLRHKTLTLCILTFQNNSKSTVFCCCSVCGAGDPTQGLAHGRQVLYHGANSPAQSNSDFKISILNSTHFLSIGYSTTPPRGVQWLKALESNNLSRLHHLLAVCTLGKSPNLFSQQSTGNEKSSPLRATGR